jgi:PAS domain-containing protein
LDSRAGNADIAQDYSKLKQQNIQLQHLLKYKDDVEIPALKRHVARLQGDFDAAQGQLQETSKQEEFLEKRTGILHLDSESRLIKINNFALEVLGVPVAQAMGKPIRDLGVHAQSGRPIFGDIEYYLEPEGRESEWEKEIPMPNGDKRYFHFRSALLGGTRLLSVTDVTDLRVWESRVKAIVGTSKDGIALVDEGGVIRSTNARFGRMFGLNWRQFIGMQFYIAADLLQYHFRQPQEFVDFFSAIQRDAQLQREGLYEMVLPQPASYQIFTRPIVDEQSRLIGRVWFITDVSQFKEMERKLLANAQDLEDKVRLRTEELSVQNQELNRVRQETEME